LFTFTILCEGVEGPAELLFSAEMTSLDLLDMYDVKLNISNQHMLNNESQISPQASEPACVQAFK
jgi:hypothetical protein